MLSADEGARETMRTRSSTERLDVTLFHQAIPDSGSVNSELTPKWSASQKLPSSLICGAFRRHRDRATPATLISSNINGRSTELRLGRSTATRRWVITHPLVSGVNP